MTSLTGRTAMVTGAGSGIGRATAQLLARRGANVMVADINRDAAAAVVAEIAAAGGTADAAFIDICSEAAIAAAVAATVARFGRLDILHNNAAYAPQEVIAADTDILSIPIEVWDAVMTGTLRGTMLCCRHGIRAMLKTGGGSIVNTSSMYGVGAFNLMPAYGVSKAGINLLTQQVATAFGRQGIRCNAVAPSMVRTPMLEGAIPEELIRINEDSTLTGSLPSPDQIATVVAFLASDDASHMTGQILHVDAGTTAHLPTYDAARRFFGQ